MAAPRAPRRPCPVCQRSTAVSRADERIAPHGPRANPCVGSRAAVDLYGGSAVEMTPEAVSR